MAVAAGPAVLQAAIVQPKGQKLACLISFLTGDSLVSCHGLALPTLPSHTAWPTWAACTACNSNLMTNAAGRHNKLMIRKATPTNVVPTDAAGDVCVGRV